MTPDVAVVGAGPYGLAVAAELRRRGVPFRIFGTPMETWEARMPTEMLLKSEGFASNIGMSAAAPTLGEYCAANGILYAASGLPVSRNVFAAYGRAVQSLVAPAVEELRVVAIRLEGAAFRLELESGESLASSCVVLATGLMGHAYLPPVLVGSEGVSHSIDHRSFDEFAGAVVAVVGGGQSALETADLLARAGSYPYVVVRAPRLVWNTPPDEASGSLLRQALRPRSGIGIGWRALAAERAPQALRLLPERKRLQVAFSTLGPAGAWWLRASVEDRVPVLAAHEVVGASFVSDQIRLSLRSPKGHHSLEVDHVIAATGYRYSLDHVSFLDPALRGRIRRVGEAPWLSMSFESSVPGLYFVGFAATSIFGPSMRFVCGTAAAAEGIGRAVARRRPHRPAFVDHGTPTARNGHRTSRPGPKNDLLVLCYHAVSDAWESYLAVRPKALHAQLTYLAAQGYRSVGFAELVTERPPGRAVAVTFDDAYRSILEEALPVLNSLGMRATIFVPTHYVEQEASADWPGMEQWAGPLHAPHLRIMGWDGVRRLAATRWEIASHSHTHRRLRGLDRETLDEELQTSKALCEERVQVPCRSIAYPYGSPGRDLDRIVADAAADAGYEAGATIPRRLAPVEPLLWPRISVGAADSPAMFKAKVSPHARRLRTLPGWAAIDAPRHLVRDRLLATASARRAETLAAAVVHPDTDDA
jgi:peptidoglycan/xylan/chitin deacetylase (PgdA/CDA1 family)